MKDNNEKDIIDKLAIFGTSGFAYEVADIAIFNGVKEIVLLTNEKLDVSLDSRYPIVHETQVTDLEKDGFSFAIGIGEPKLREKVFNKYKTLKYPNLIHKNATLGHKQRELVCKSKGNIITAGVVMTNNIIVGNFCVFNLLTTVGHDCIVGDFVSIMPAVNISGNVELGRGVYIGVGATVLQGEPQSKLSVGEGTIIGAASLVRKPLPSYKIAVGSPAKVIKDISH